MPLVFKQKIRIARYKGHNLLNKRSEIINKCLHWNKFVLALYDRKDWNKFSITVFEHSCVRHYSSPKSDCLKSSWVVSGISVFRCWLVYLANMHMKSQFPQACLAHSSREINQITGDSDSLRGLNFENCESEPYINDFILRISLYCKFFVDRCMLFCIVFFPRYYNTLLMSTL